MGYLFKNISNRTLCYTDTSRTTSRTRNCIAHGYNFQKRFIKHLWNILWTTSNSRWTQAVHW